MNVLHSIPTLTLEVPLTLVGGAVATERTDTGAGEVAHARPATAQVLACAPIGDAPDGGSANALPVPRPPAPQQPARSEYRPAWHSRPWQRLRAACGSRRLDPADVRELRVRQHEWALLGNEGESALRAALRVRLAARGLTPHLRAEALACIAAQARRVLRRDPFDTQLLCARALMDGDLVEVATGEGETLSIALAAAATALSGTPVHVLTVNDYLAARDARLHAPLFHALGLSVGVIAAASTSPQRRAAYGADITYVAAHEIALDHLRDAQSVRPAGASDRSLHASAFAAAPVPGLLQRGLCCALLAEADSLLIDEAVMPLVLAEPENEAQPHVACLQALALARELELGTDAVLDTAQQSVHWTEAGLRRLETLSSRLGAVWLDRRHGAELTAQAIVALHALHRQHDYLVEDGRVTLLDRLTGQRGRDEPPGSRVLQTLVELKEGCRPGCAHQPVAQTSLRRFLRHYDHLAGTSGTLAECRGELAAVYGKVVVHLPPRRASLREVLPPRVFEASCQREWAAVRRIRQLHSLGRPVLVGVASAPAAQALSVALAAEGIAHQVLDGRHEAREAQVIAKAGQPAAVTVATALAGRGTDIELGPCVAGFGGLHVLDLLDTPCARTRRRFIGRTACHGDPGSAETWHAADTAVWTEGFLDSPRGDAPPWLVHAASRLQQTLHGWARRRQRRRMSTP